MNRSQVRTGGLTRARPGREATTGATRLTDDANHGRGAARRTRPGRRREELMAGQATFTSYYGKPILNKPTWEAPDIPGYLFLGGLAGASSVLAALGQATGRPGLARATKLGSTAAAGLSVAALVHDLGRPARFLNMLRMIKPTSPMSVGSWILAPFGALSTAASAAEITGRLPRAGAAATAGAAVLGPALATYTAVLVSDTAVPAWHEGHREMPFLFAASAAAAASGLSLLTAPSAETAPARRLALASGVTEMAMSKLLEWRVGLAAECYETGTASHYRKAADALTALGVLGAATSRRLPAAGRLGGLALLAGSAATRFAVFHAGVASTEDPKYVVQPQRERMAERERQEKAASATATSQP